MAIKVTKSQEDKRIDALQGKGSGGGVGENVGQHNERFNGYTTSDGSTINGGDYNHAEGYKNTLNGCNKSHVSGNQNTALGAIASIVSGTSNNVSGGSENIVSGSTNTVLGGTSNTVSGISNNVTGGSSNIISGDLNVLNTVYRSIVVGNSNDVTSSTGTSAVFGVNNQVTGVRNAIISGEDNDVTGSWSACFGEDIILTKNNCLACGNGVDTTNISGNIIFIAGSGGNKFYIKSSGDCYAAGGYNSMGADYAEYFEWADGNPLNEDRTGMLVSLFGDKIELAHGDDFIGAVSVSPSMVGNGQFTHWRGRFETDVFGRVQYDEAGKPIISDDYNPKMKYIPRADRPEWSPIGLVGRLIIVDDGSCKVGGYVSARRGIGTACFAKTAARVLKRIDYKHIEVLIK